MLLTRVYDALLTIAYPQACLVCGGSVEQRSLGIACAACWKATRVVTGAETICWKCGVLSPAGEVSRPASKDSRQASEVSRPASEISWEVRQVSRRVREDVRCSRCDSQSFTFARAVGSYENALRQSVLSLKRQPHLSSYLTDLLVTVARREPLNEATRIIPVPLHDKRVRERGFNQASVIAGALSNRLELPLDEASLIRIGASEKYRAGLDPKGRRDTVTGAFAVRHPRLVAGENVLLVDDVFTTGATVNACAEVLLASGARQVLVLTVARGKS